MPAIPATQRRRRPKAASPIEADSLTRGEQYHLKAIARALEVLECFGDSDSSLNLKEIARLVKLPESSLFRILLTLKGQGYLLQLEDGSYRLPDKLLYGRVQERAERCRKILHPYLQDLAARFDETASMAYLFGDQVRALDTVETFQEIRMTNRPGRVLPPHCSSLGKSITAFQTPAQVERMLEAYGLFRRTENTIVDRHLLLDEYAKVRSEGYACDRQETILGGVCIGAPIAIRKNQVDAAISLSTPIVRMTPERELEITQAVKAAALRASQELQKSF